MRLACYFPAHFCPGVLGADAGCFLIFKEAVHPKGAASPSGIHINALVRDSFLSLVNEGK